MESRIIFHRAGMGVSLQDEGRRGFLRYGVGWSGPMDWLRAGLAMQLTKSTAPVLLETGIGGLEVEFSGAPLRIGIAAPGFRITCADQEFTSPVSLVPPAGARLVINPGKQGMWGYLALGGRALNLAPVLDSYATHIRAGLGAFWPHAGAELTLASDSDAAKTARFTLSDPCDVAPEKLAVIPGPQWDMLTPHAQKSLFTQDWQIDRRMDRMGYWLQGEPLALVSGHDLPSEGMVLGAIEVSGDGRLVVVLADGQPTGGYPKPAILTRAALPHFVQMRPGETVRFSKSSLEEAVEAYKTLA